MLMWPYAVSRLFKVHITNVQFHMSKTQLTQQNNDHNTRISFHYASCLFQIPVSKSRYLLHIFSYSRIFFFINASWVDKRKRIYWSHQMYWMHYYSWQVYRRNVYAMVVFNFFFFILDKCITCNVKRTHNWCFLVMIKCIICVKERFG